MARALMIQGTGSDVGKSLMVAGLCRAFYRRGIATAPFKPQNMSNNAAVAHDGGEIGRAQALQARAAGLKPSHHMNPVLLKPQANRQAQLVVRGAAQEAMDARAYRTMAPSLLPTVTESFAILARQHDLLLVEGAGSPAEINLRAGDIANMGFAEAVDIPVILVGDIDRGGIIAQIAGTYQLLPLPERMRLKGFIVNKFRGDQSLFTDGARMIEARTGMPNLGIVPFFERARHLPAEDSLSLQKSTGTKARIKIAVLRLPHMANFDDLDPLMAESDVDLQWIEPGMALPPDAALVIIPGSKATVADLEVIRTQEWDIDLRAHWRRGGMILGLCGGYQMLGQSIRDEGGREGGGAAPGLGYVPMTTILGQDKSVTETHATDRVTQRPVKAYEIHLGQSLDLADTYAWFRLADGRGDGFFHDRIAGTYLHGIFVNDEFRRAFLQRLAPAFQSNVRFEEQTDRIIDALADHLEASLDLDQILALSQVVQA